MLLTQAESVVANNRESQAVSLGAPLLFGAFAASLIFAGSGGRSEAVAPLLGDLVLILVTLFFVARTSIS